MEMTNSVHPNFYLQEFLGESNSNTNDPIIHDGSSASNIMNHHQLQEYYQQNGNHARLKAFGDGYYVANSVPAVYADASYTIAEIGSHLNTAIHANLGKPISQTHAWGSPEMYAANFNSQYSENQPTPGANGQSAKHQHTNSSCSNSTRTSNFETYGELPSPSAEFSEVKKPKIQTVYWGEKNTTCYQVKARAYTVSRRLDNHYVNGTKLLNVVGMSRGKRDGILKSEKKKDVVKVGSINLKGVWIPFDRAYEIARNEGVDSILFPLFVKDIEAYYSRTGYKLRTDDSPDSARSDAARSDYEEVEIPTQEPGDLNKYSGGNINDVDFRNTPTQMDPVFRQQYFEPSHT